MKKLYHICLTAHSEVLLRNIDDVRLMTNLPALAAWRSGTDILIDSRMSTHSHEIVSTEDPHGYACRQIISITKAYNSKYQRSGRLFDSDPFILELSGPRHSQMAMCYSLRQGLHHAQSETPFDYHWSTCNHVFRESRGVPAVLPTLTSRSEIASALPKSSDFPDGWTADSEGILLRDSFEQIALVETWFGTPRNYMFSMIRKTSEEWLAEQSKDSNSAPIVDLNLLERGYTADDIRKMIDNETNSKYRRGYGSHQYSDMQICEIIDNQMLGRFKAASVYQLDNRQKQSIALELKYDFGVKSDPQIARCLAMNYLL
ncbi:MAG: hypothetical protein MJY70_07660 [Bacteroidales bacterium]|nr:hypothetical protein [Bacteroidales bacterium]